MRFLLTLSALLLFSLPCHAQSVDGPQKRKPTIIGQWRSYKVLGEPCNSLTQVVEYDFDHDGYYSITSETKSAIGSTHRSEASGTYEINGSSITGTVGEQKMGPFYFKVDGNSLMMRSSEPTCTFYFLRKHSSTP